jgi:hypothetical protein
MLQGGSAQGQCCRGFCALLVAAGLVVLIYWAIFQPHHIRATVDSATLSNLTVSNASSAAAAAVSYDLTVSLRLYNPSVRVNIYYDAIDAELRFRDAVVGPAANDTSPVRVLPSQEDQRGREDGVRLLEAGWRRRRHCWQRRRPRAGEGNQERGAGELGAGVDILDEAAHVMDDIQHTLITAHGLHCDRISLEYFEPKIPIRTVFLALFLVLVK